MTPEKIQGLIELVGALTLLVTTIGTVVQTIRFGKAKRERDAAYEEAQAEVQGALQDRQHSPEEAKEAAAVRTAGLKERAKTKALAKPKAPLALLLALVGLSGCASTNDADLRQLADQQRLERTVERQAEDLAELQAALASHAQALQQHQQALAQVRQVASQAGLQGAMAPLTKMAERFELVGARLDHAEDGLERAGWKRDPELAAQVAEIKAAAEAEQGGGE